MNVTVLNKLITRTKVDLEAIKESIEDVQLRRRIQLLIIFAFFEAACHMIRQRVLKNIEEEDYQKLDDDDELDIYWYAAINESVAIAENGKPKRKAPKFDTKSHLLFSLRFVAKLNGITDDSLNNSEAKELMKKAFEIRNRVTHPKRMNDLDISDQEVKTVREFLLWFGARLNEFMPKSEQIA